MQGTPGGPDDSPASWPDPIPLCEVPRAAPFPLAVLPDSLQRLVAETAAAMNCPPDYVAVPLLALAGGAVGNSRWIEIKPGYREPPLLFAGVVGRPGTTKSAPLKFLRRPFDQAQERLVREWRANSSADEGDPSGGGRAPSRLSRCITGDATTEALKVILSENPRGIVIILDELAGLAEGMNQDKGGSGNDRQFFLSLWDAIASITDRKGDLARGGGPTYLAAPFASIVGTIQPGVLRAFNGRRGARAALHSDEFFERFLLAYPDELPAVGEQWAAVSADAQAGWAKVIGDLLALQMVATEVGGWAPVAVCLSDSGRRGWQRFTDVLAAEMNDGGFPDQLRGFWSKLKGYGARIALILHLLRRACGEPVGEEVDNESVARAAAVIEYFKSHSRRVAASVDADPRVAGARKLLRWVYETGQQVFSGRDAHRALRGATHTVDESDAVLDLLLGHGLVRPILAPVPRKRGNQPSQKFEAHPSIVDSGRIGHKSNCGVEQVSKHLTE